jgi:ribose transport system permease protein
MARKIAWLCLNNSILIVLVMLCILMGLANDRFFTAANWTNILNNVAVAGIISFGVALVLIAGGIDLSFSAILACCAMLAAWLEPCGFWPAVLGPIALGAVLGLFNGALVALIDANPLITTLGTQWLYYSSLFIITKGQLIQGGDTGAFHFIGHGRVLGLPFPVCLLGITCLVVWGVASQTVFGKYIYAHGSNRDGLRYAGVPARRVYLYSFLAMGILVGLGGVVLSSRVAGVRPTEGDRYLLIVLTSVLLSGVSLSGGTGSILHVLAAVVTLGVIDNGMVLLGLAYKYQQMVRGCIFVLAVLYSNFMAARLASFRVIKE